MRVKSDERRDAILRAATEIFLDIGYANASMAMISTRIGGSKSTLYGYFKSKEELFAAAMMAVMEEQAQQIVALLDISEPDTRLALCRFGKALLAMLMAPDTVAIMRAAIAEGGNSKLGALLYEQGAAAGWKEMAAYIVHLQERGSLRPADPLVAAAHLKGLLETGFVDPLLFGAEPWFEPDEAVAAAVDAFLKMYGS
ncbi:MULTISPECIES: TetR/AcrR family transcriptional regulator [unclassified Sphingomonas]|uniref:TetR/AcrR family transcriptional regulator n=1 Tax=unclassified Sphingomonas TaxID=196159 RepID=UPI0006FB5DC1|nr:MULTISPECIES: TetR/AcrR family transcriptional regulator [unclassified Sphingomonas]KQM59834.1 hypothetical protein ASE65_08820 [Sphingomonas sp. Leaf16]KQN11232.1 hypothetical protein ASE81_09805 [Sphingomonas sp. Leaf29]KQN18553.1 hypothetical protein ASE83_09750 [Sphingomonas sp. Leaf32]